MPLPLSTEDRFSLVLRTDEKLPQEKQPRFFFRFLSGREQRRQAEKFDELERLNSSVQRIDKLFAILKNVLVGWENMPNGLAYDLERVEDVLQFSEAQELIYRAWSYSPRIEDLKNLESQSPIPSGKSAGPENATPVKTP